VHRGAAALAAVLALAWGAPVAAQPTPSPVAVPFAREGVFGDVYVELTATEHRPAGPGPFPAIVLNHGSPGKATDRPAVTGNFPVATRAFVEWGFVVLSPVRRGYGATGGRWSETYGSCAAPRFVDAGIETAKDVAAAVSYLRALPYVDADRIVLVGQSAGGWGVLAAAGRPDVPVRGVVNFAGGRAGRIGGVPNKNCAPDRLVAAAGELGRAARVPSLWLYTENDQYFSPELSARMHKAYTDAGGRASYVLFAPIGRDGHGLIGMKHGVPLWEPKVAEFFREVGVLPAR